MAAPVRYCTDIMRTDHTVTSTGTSFGRRVVAVALAVAAIAVGAGCGGGGSGAAPERPASAAEAAPTGFGLVSPGDAVELAATPGVTVIDVRTPEEFAGGHLAGADLLDFYGATFAADVAALDPAGTYLVYCRSGSRSAQAVALMGQFGIERVYDMAGGILAYSAEGLPLAP